MKIIRQSTILFFACFLLLCVTGCANNADKNSAPSATPVQENTKTNGAQKGEGETLVVYFSRAGEQYTVGVIEKGNTAIVAQMIAEETGANTFELVPADDRYPESYDKLTEVARQEQNEKARPAYRGETPDLSKVKTVFIGAPVWWGDWPMICYTFFEKSKDALAGKTLIPFSTHEGSGLSGFDSKLSEACPSSNVGEGLAIRGSTAQNNRDDARASVKDWLARLGY